MFQFVGKRPYLNTSYYKSMYIYIYFYIITFFNTFPASDVYKMFKFWVDLWPGGNWMGLIFGGTVLESHHAVVCCCISGYSCLFFKSNSHIYIYIYICLCYESKLRMYNKKTLYNLHYCSLRYNHLFFFLRPQYRKN